MIITTTELKNNFSKYVSLLDTEDIFVTLKGKTVAKLVNPQISAVDAISGLIAGMLPKDYNTKDLRVDKIKKYEYQTNN